MRLTNQLRAAIVGDIMSDTPRIDYDGMARVIVIRALTTLLPPLVRYNLTALEPWLRRGRIDMPLGLHDVYWYRGGCDSDVMAEKFEDLYKGELTDLGIKNRQQESSRYNLRSDLNSMVRQFRTTVDLLKACPELKKYVPDAPIKISNAPVSVAVIAKLCEAGWPKEASTCQPE